MAKGIIIYLSFLCFGLIFLCFVQRIIIRKTYEKNNIEDNLKKYNLENGNRIQ